MISQTTAATTGNTDTSQPSAPVSSSDPIANEQMFLQLLVAQIKNQNPLNPTDGVQFLSQLAQFSQLEQLIGIKTDLDGITQSSPASTSSNSTNAATPKSST